MSERTFVRLARFFGLLVLACVLVAACDPGVGLRIENDSDVPVCLQESDHHYACKEMLTAPGESKRFAILCTGDDILYLVVERVDNGAVIHRSEATCDRWNDSGSKIVVSNVDGRIEARASIDPAE